MLVKVSANWTICHQNHLDGIIIIRIRQEVGIDMPSSRLTLFEAIIVIAIVIVMEVRI